MKSLFLLPLILTWSAAHALPVNKLPGKRFNTAPKVNAGIDISVNDSDRNGSQFVQLAGSATDRENNITKYVLYKNGTQVLTSTTSEIFRGQHYLPLGSTTFTMEAVDAGGLSHRDSVIATVNKVIIANTAPVVSAGADFTVIDSDNNGSQDFNLRGSATDAENNIVKYYVHKNGQAYAGGSTPYIFTQSINLPLGVHEMTLEATDAGNLVGSDKVIISVVAGAMPNTAPMVNAGADISRTDSDNNGSEMITLAGSATDAQNNISSYRVLRNGVQVATSLSASISVPVGSHTIVMEATDAGGLKGSDTMLINIVAAPVTPPPAGGTAPIANAGPDIRIVNDDFDNDGEATGVEITTVNGSATQGSNPIVSYVWKVNNAVVAKGSSPTLLQNQRFNYIKGSNLITLEVTDSAGLKGVDSAIVENKPSLNDIVFLGRGTIPGVLSVSAGGQRFVLDQDGSGSEMVRMVGSVSSVNPIVNYKWMWRGQVLAQGSSPDVLTTSLNLQHGVNNLTLHATDSMGNTIADHISVDVTSPVVEQKNKIPSDPSLLTNHLVPEWYTGPSHWKDESAFRFRCKPSHLLFDDPIVFPGQPGKAHLHMFFGNTLANGNSTYESLRQSGDGSCDGGPLNRSAYWMPALMNENGKVVVPDLVTIYYKKHPGTNRFPRGLKMIFGYDHRYPDKKLTNWKCASGGGQFTTIAEVNCPASVNGNNQLMVTLAAPSCWDGKNLDSPDHRSHMSYGSYNGYGENVCPDTHPVNIPTFTMLVSWSHNGAAEYSKWRLSSDHVSPHDSTSAQIPGGTSFHTDWFGGWDDSVMDMWIDGCMNQFKSCSGGALGMGKQLKENPGFSFLVDPTKRLIDPPAKPIIP